MGKNRETKSRCNGRIIKQFVAIALPCLLLTFVFVTDLQAGRNYTITASAGANGTMAPSGALTVPSGGSQAFTITPNTGYHVLNVTVDSVSQGAITSYSFTNVRANHTIAATFEINTYTITAMAWSGGTVSPPTATVNHGGNQTFTITPNTGYYVADVAVDGVSQGAITSYNFTNVTANHTITAAFANSSYALTATAGSGGAVAPATATVNHGGSQTFTITPNSGYQIAFVMVDGVSKGVLTSYTFTNVATAHTITATFTNNTSSPPSSLANYFYDDLGRLTRVVADTAGAIYQYDELGNLVSVTNATTTNGSPVITGINPNILFIGSPQPVTITGQNLLATDSVTSVNVMVAVSNVTISDTQITALMTPLAIGMDAIRVTSRNGTPNTAEITIPVSTLALSPGQLAITPGSSGTIAAVISPPPPTPMTITLNNSDPSIASIPQSVTVPVNGSADITVNGLQLGDTTISSGEKRAVVFVTSPFSGDVNGLAANRVSVMIDAPTGASPTAATPVSVVIDAPTGASPTTATPVSVIIDAPSGASPTAATPVSVIIDTPAGNSTTPSLPVSVKIQ